MLDRWEALTNYVDDGRIEIDNNIAERALRLHRAITGRSTATTQRGKVIASVK